MAEFPALPLFTDAFIADTKHLSESELGAYVNILVLMWRSPGCRLPADAGWHMRKLGVSSLKYKELYEPLFFEFLTGDGSYLTQKRLKREFEYLTAQREQKRGAAKSRWNKEKHPRSAYAPTPTPTPPIPSEAKASSGNAPGLFPDPIKPVKEKKNGRAETTFPNDFIANTETSRLCGELGLVEHEEFNAFRDWTTAKGQRYRDWQAAFRSHLRRAASRRKPGGPTITKPTYIDSIARAVGAVNRDFENRKNPGAEEDYG